jgi:hypothetical protein
VDPNFPFINNEILTSLCQSLYFPTEDYTLTTFVLANACLFHLMRDVGRIPVQEHGLAKTDSQGRTAVAYAAIEGHVEVVPLLLNHKASPTTPDSNGLAPIHHAAKRNHVEVLRRLLAAGVDPMPGKSKRESEYKDKEFCWQECTHGETPIQYACELRNS